MPEQEPIVISQETLDKMKAEYEELTTKGRDEMALRIGTARAMGDLKENSEYHSAKDAQGMMEARIRQLKHTINHAVVREGPAGTDVVGVGVVASVKIDDDVEEYLIAASPEEKIKGLPTVTPSSPLGAALMGKKVGEVAKVQAPKGSFDVEVVGIRPA